MGTRGKGGMVCDIGGSISVYIWSVSLSLPIRCLFVFSGRGTFWPRGLSIDVDIHIYLSPPRLLHNGSSFFLPIISQHPCTLSIMHSLLLPYIYSQAKPTSQKRQVIHDM